MQDFYSILDIYADQHGMSPATALEKWYRGGISVRDLLENFLEEEGIFGYTDIVIRTVRTLGAQCRKDHGEDPWKEEV